MRTYTVFSSLSVILALALDQLLKTGLIQNRKFWLFHLVMVILTTVMDSYSSGLPIVIFNPESILNSRVLSVPIENYFFGFALITVNLVIYEYSQKRNG